MANLGDLKKNLLAKYQNDLIASVYLAKYPASGDPEGWVRDFLKSITPLEDHPDVLWVKRSDTENEYKVESAGITALLKFLNYRPYELKKKFILITDAHLMSTIVSNKLLKVFEELSSNFCLFLFAPQEENLLATVESRAIKVLLPESTQEIDYDAPLIEYSSPQDLVAQLKSSSDEFLLEKKFIEVSLNKTLQKPSFEACSKDLENLKHHSLSEAFNNSKLSRLSPFFK